MTSSNGNIFRVTGHLCGEFTGPGEFPTQGPVTRSFDVFFDLHLNKRLSKQWWGWWFETLSRPLWRHRNGEVSKYGLSESTACGNQTSVRMRAYVQISTRGKMGEVGGVGGGVYVGDREWMSWGDFIYTFMLDKLAAQYIFTRCCNAHIQPFKFRTTRFCEGNHNRFPSKRTSNAENVSIWLRHHVILPCNPAP